MEESLYLLRGILILFRGVSALGSHTWKISTNSNSLYGVTTYVVALDDVVKGYGASLHVAILGYSIPFFGVMFAPLVSPHLSELFGRRNVYQVCVSLYALCVVVTGLAPGISTLLAFRFLAGLFGGPCVILIEGTFADIWTAKRTVTYYACLDAGAYLGASFGKLITYCRLHRDQ